MNATRTLLFFFVVPLFILPLATATPVSDLPVTVDEAASRLEIAQGAVDLRLALVNVSGADITVQVELEFLTPSGAMAKTASRKAVLKPRMNVLEFRLDRFFSALTRKDVDEFHWFRIRYRILPATSSGPVSSANSLAGVISVSRIMRDVLRLQIAAPDKVVPGERLKVPVFTRASGSEKAIGGIDVEGVLTIVTGDDEGGERKETSTARTGAHGEAMLEFRVPANLSDEDVSLKVTATRGAEVREVEESLYQDERWVRVLLTTDKPIYRPSELLNMRVLALHAEGSALAKRRFRLEVSEPGSNTTTFRADLETSRFGEAHTEWAIPENARPGVYDIGVEDSEGNTVGSVKVDIKQYDLPNFTIRTKTDRRYYLPGEAAEVQVQTNYLFGQPVAGAKVKIVEIPKPYWQQLGMAKRTPIEGVTDANGKFAATVDPRAMDSPALSEARRWIRVEGFEDQEYTAYVTDPLSGRTEERRFDLRTSQDPIHIHMTRPFRMGKEGPVEFHVSTQYADGTPASCVLEIRSTPRGANWWESNREPSQMGALLARIRTDRFGIARIPGFLIPPIELLLFSADDDAGNHGWKVESTSVAQYDVNIETEKIIFSAGDPLRIQFRSIYKSGPVMVDLLHDERILDTRIVYLKDGAAATTFGWSDRFHGEIAIVARYVGDLGGDLDSRVRMVSYPSTPRLKLEAIPGKPVYAPGEEARVSFRVQSAEGGPQPSLLGVVVRDRAVDERAETAHERLPNTDSYEAIEREIARLTGSEPIPDSLRPAVEFLMTQRAERVRYASGFRDFSESYSDSPSTAFHDLINKQFAPLKAALNPPKPDNPKLPQNEASLWALLAAMGVDRLLDPWDRPYRVDLSENSGRLYLAFTSAGSNPAEHVAFTAFSTGWRLNDALRVTLNRVVTSYTERTGSFLRDMPSLRAAFREAGEDIDSWRDFWGRPYAFGFGIDQTSFTIDVFRTRSDGVADTRGEPAWRVAADYTAAFRRKAEPALERYRREFGRFPENESQFDDALRRAGVGEADRLDPWGHAYYVTFEKEPTDADVVLERWLLEIPYEVYLEFEQHNLPDTAATRRLAIRSRGPGDPRMPAGVVIGVISWVETPSKAAADAKGRVEGTPAAPQNTEPGVISGVIRYQFGAPLPKVRVRLVGPLGDEDRTVTSDDKGAYAFIGLKPGSYRAVFEAGNQSRAISGIPVEPGKTTILNGTLNAYVGRGIDGVGSSTILNPDMISEIRLIMSPVDAEAGRGNGQIQIATLQSFAERQVRAEGPIEPGTKSMPLGMKMSGYTPRLREYFPETLVWNPALETDKNGQAELRFKLADNITTWKLEVVASTLDGRLTETETEILAYQPFFLEHDPPRILTEGDTVALPVTIRSYLEQDQSLDIAMKPEPWFTTVGNAEQKTNIKAGESTTATFSFKATAVVKDGPQRITAIGTAASDNIEKKVTVHPDGREIVETESRIVKGRTTFDLHVPPTAISGTARAEIKIYPDLVAHIADAIEGILERPHGCAEQVISSTYPSLMLLRFEKTTSRHAGPLASKARRYLENGYARLLAYQSKDGGFTYWGNGDSDIALTAYAVRFLAEAQPFIAVDESSLQRAVQWLVSRQRGDGSWSETKIPEANDPFGDLTLTTTVLQALSMDDVAKLLNVKKRDTVGDALKYSKAHVEQFGEPYSFASLALAALQRSDRETARWALQHLEMRAQAEGAGSYWSLRSDSPFFGWGIAGRIEGSALSVHALAEGIAAGIQTAKTQSLVDGGLAFLLGHKDRYGVWFSTQATAQVLNALSRVPGVIGGNARAGKQLELLVNGTRVQTIALPRGDGIATPITVDISRFLLQGANRIEVISDGNAATAQVVSTYYVPWTNMPERTLPEGPRLTVRFDKTQAQSGETFTATVHTERVGSARYGMMLAEIGLPPGVDVDRESLERALGGNSGLFRYEIRPDRIVAYLWPRSGVSDFRFRFRARFGIDAQTPPSVLYDYYNPDDQVIQPPTHFVVR